MYEKELQNLGLSEKEAKVYTTALELGPDTVQNIAKESGINRATTYVQIESLKKKGLMSEFEKGKKTFYSAESPEILTRLVEKRETEVQFQKIELNNVIPQLMKHFSSNGDRPKIRFFEGDDGIAQIMEDFLKHKNEKIVGFSNVQKVLKKFSTIKPDYSDRRIQQNISSKLIYTTDNGMPMPGASDRNKLRELKFVSKSKFPFDADITIYRNKVALIPFSSKNIGIIIENQEIADTMRGVFHLLWESL